MEQAPPADKGYIEKWLNQKVSEVPEFADVLNHHKLRNNFDVTPIKSTKKLKAIGLMESLPKD